MLITDTAVGDSMTVIGVSKVIILRPS